MLFRSDILNELRVPQTKVLNILNKIDLTNEKEALEKAAHLDLLENKRHIMISSKNGYNVEQLKEMINSMIFELEKVDAKMEQKKSVDADTEYIKILKDTDISINIDRKVGSAVAALSGPSIAFDPIEEVFEDEGSGS